MYHKSADSWHIGTGKQGFEPKNEGDVPRKHEILVHHFFYRINLFLKEDSFHIFACTSCISEEV